MSAAAREPAAHPRKPVASPDRASPSKKPFYVGPSNSAASAVAQAPSVAPKPTYITQRRAPRAQQPPTATDRDESRDAPYLRWDDPPPQTAGEAVTETAVGSLPPPSHRSGSPSAKFTVVPCVAHPVYTKHQNCGCLRSRSGSPTHKEPEQPKPKFRWDDLMPTPPTPALEPPPPPVFEAPQKLLNVKGLKHLRHVAATGGMAVLATESNGSVVQARHSVTGACLPDGEAHVAVPKQTDVPVTAMTTVDKHVWCGHLDGSIRIYNAEGMLFESVKHSGAVQCFVAFASERAVYAGSADWYISKWTQSSLTQWKSVMVGGHTLGVRALCEAVTSAATYLCSAGDDAELRIWLVASSAKNALSPGSPTAASPAPQQQTNTPTMTLKKHHGAVLSCLYAFDTLWSGGEDATVRRWSLSEKRQLAELKGHSSAVLSMHKVGTSVWTLGKDGLGIMFDGDTGAAVHTMAFFDPAAFSKSAHRLAAQLFYVQPVTGHVLWISDPAGETAAWYAPTETPEVEEASNNLLASRGGVAFEESERIVALYFEAEAAQRRLVDGLRIASEEYASGVNAAIMDATAQLERHMTWLQSADRDAPPPPPPPVVVVAPPAESDLQLVQELRRQLKDALEKIAAFQSGDALQSDAVEELRTIALSMQSENRTLVGQLDAANARILDLETSLHAMQEAMHGDQFALNRRNSELETKLSDLRLELDSKDVEIAALRAALSQTEQPSAELLGLRSKLQAMEQEIERHVARGKESNAAAAAAAEQIDKLKKELQHREQLLDKLLLEKDSAVAKMSQQDVDGMTALANARTDIKRLQTELQKSQSYVEGLAADRDRFSKLAEQREAEIARLQALSRDRDREEVAVRQSYEGRIAELISRLAQYDDRSIDGKLNEMNAANSDLRKKLGEFTSPRYVDLLNENSDLKRQLGEHREHIMRLLQHDQRLEAMVRDLRERAAHAARDAFEAARRSQSPKAEPMHHDMSSPHHRETCIWCSGAVNVSAGTTFGHKKGSPDRGAPQQRSRSRSPQVAAGDPVTTRRSGSAPEVLTVGPPPASSSPSSDPVTTHPSTARVSIRGLDLNGSPRTVERRKEKRVAQLKTATESTTNEAVKAALIDQILAIHQQVVGAPTAAARPTAANADGA